MVFLFLFIWIINGVILWQDFKTRSIHWLNIPLLVVAFFLMRILGFIDVPVWDIVFNVSFVLIQLLGISIYFFIREKRWSNPVDHKIGLGDVLYFLALAMAFPRLHFVFFMISGLLFSILSYGLYMLMGKGVSRHIPLAALMAVWFLGFFTCTLYAPDLVIYPDHLLMYFYE